ncbi:MAG: nicotinate phosphoribosyltransferase [Gammaproteobacteria bacterium]|nr:nicotinate phosphoribosyltransferase [Gammaproteobacteria bacterium]
MNPATSPLLTDLYQLTMLQGYFDRGMEETAVFELFVRRLPRTRGFLLAAGLEQALDFLEHIRFSPEELDWLRATGRFNAHLIDRLASLRFTGEIHALPEGTPFFANEPILRVTAPLPEAQLVESRLMNILHFQTLIASKAARCVLAAPGKLLVDFGMRRAHGAEAGMFAARASYLAGFAGSSTVLADAMYGIPSFGTMAHSYIQAHGNEATAFEHFALSQRDNVVLLIDTYDTEAAAHTVVRIAPRLREQGITIKSVRLDSGDLLDHSRRVRAILDAGGLNATGIFCSGGLDESELQRLNGAGAPIDGFGIGTHMDTSSDAPYLDCAYKLQEYAGVARRKRSEGKATWPGRKQIYRSFSAAGQPAGDILTLESDPQGGKPLLKPYMKNGRRTAVAQPLDQIRRRTREQLASLPSPLARLDPAYEYPVTVSDALRELAASIDRGEHS